MKIRYLTCILFLFTVISISNVQALPFPERPFNPWGTILVNGGPILNATIVRAYVNGILCGETLSVNNWYSINVIAKDPLLNCGTEGAEVIIKIKDGIFEIDAQTPLNWSAGATPNVNLTINKADLVIDDIWDNSGYVQYRIRNQGTATAGINNVYLTVDGVYKDAFSCVPLTPGSYGEPVFSYHWKNYCTSPSDIIQVCADATYLVSESNETNNCIEETWTCPATTTTTSITTTSSSSTTTTVSGDTTPPAWSNLVEPTDPSIYNPSGTYTFSIDWTDTGGVSEVILEMDGQTYSKSAGQITQVGDTYTMTFASCILRRTGGGGGGRFYMMSLDPITPILNIIRLLTGGIAQAQSLPCLNIAKHYYKWYASDPSNNIGSTALLDFTIYRIDPVSIYIDSPENKTYSKNIVDINYSISSPFEISWIGYSLDNQPNVTLTANTTINVTEKTHSMIFYANTTYSVMNSSDIIYFTVYLPKPCTCTEWQPTGTCCAGGGFIRQPKEYWIRTCTPVKCQAESKCEGTCWL
jgi:hypothetical protein